MKQVLTVDDSASVRQMVSFTLRTAGYGVTEAIDGRDGSAKAKGQRFDLIITDLNMPNMDGIEMIAAIRKLPGYGFMPHPDADHGVAAGEERRRPEGRCNGMDREAVPGGAADRGGAKAGAVRSRRRAGGSNSGSQHSALDAAP